MIILLHTSYHSISRLSDIPTCLSGWFQHAFNSSCHRSIRAPRQPQHGSPQNTEGHLDEAMCYLLDENTIPDAYNDPIWLLGLQHPGYEPPPAEVANPGSGFVNSKRALSFCTSTFSTVTPTSPRLQQSRLSKRHTRILTHIIRQNCLPGLPPTSGSYYAPISTPSETLHLPSSSANTSS